MPNVRRDVWKLPANDKTLEWYGKAVEALQARLGAGYLVQAAASGEEDAEEDEDDPDAPRTTRRRSRRGGRGRRAGGRNAPLEGTFDHGEEGYGLWLDPAIQDNPVYAEHWAGHRPVEVAVEEDRIVIRRVSEDED